MASTLAKLKQASIEPIYDYLDFSDFHPLKKGRIRYRVNLTKKMRTEVEAMVKERDEVNAILGNPNATSDEKSAAYDRYIANNDHALTITASLVMADDEKGSETLTLEEWKEWIASERDEEDSQFTAWVQSEVIGRVGDYQNQSFLSQRRSRSK